MSKDRVPEFREASRRLDSLFESLQDDFARAQADSTQKIADLEDQLMKARQSEAVHRDAAITRAEKLQVLESQVDQLQSGGDLIVVLIDGDGLIFTMERLIAGREGGKTAVADLRSAISDEATGAGVKFEHMLVMYFCRKSGLAGVLKENGVGYDRFSEFMAGFNGADELVSSVEVADCKDAADEKIKAHMRLFGGFQRCKRLYLGASHDGGYTSIFESFKSRNLDRKLRLIKGYDHVPPSLLQALPSDPLVIPTLFRREKLPARRSSMAVGSPAADHSLSPNPGSLTKTVSYASALEIAAPTTSPSLRAVALPTADLDSSARSFWRHGAPKGSERFQERRALREKGKKPCNHYFLRKDGCSWGVTCLYDHDLELTSEVLAYMRKIAKTQPCFDEKDGTCEDAMCFRGHVCPEGMHCAGACKFVELPGTHPSKDPAEQQTYERRRQRDLHDLATSGGMRAEREPLSRLNPLRADASEWRVVTKK